MVIKASATIVVGSVALSGLSGCFLSFLSPIPDMSTPSSKANKIAPKCSSISEDKVASFVSPSAIDSVEPGYSFVSSTATNHEARLRGALIHLKPVEGLTKEKLARGLECHQARVTLGSAPPFPDDPYVLPNSWLTADVDSEGDGFAVQIRADTFTNAQRVLKRAKLFVANRPREAMTDHLTTPPRLSPSEGPSASMPAAAPDPSGSTAQ